MQKVTAISVSAPRTIEIHGRPVVTSIVHEPHPGPLSFGRGGPVGNSTAVHTEEVLAMAAENYDYWSSYLGIARATWTDCYWGENLTLSGLSEGALRIGDRLQVGVSAVFEVTSPRIPCFKLSWRLGQPDSFLKTLIESGRTGFYLRVIEPGEVRPGDTVTLEAAPNYSICVADLSRLLHDDSVDLAVLKSILALPALGRQAAGMLRHRVARLTDAMRCRKGRWAGWREFEVTRIDPEAATVRSFRLRPRDGAELAEYRAGQFVSVRLTTGPGASCTRAWSLSDYEEGGAAYRLTIRRTAAGIGSAHMHEQIRVGDTVELRSPAGGFTLDRSTPFRIVLISAGIGVTPLLSMLKAHAQREVPAPLLWIHSTRDGSTHALRDEVEAIIGANGDFRSHVVYTAPRSEDRLGADYQQAGRLTAEQLTALLGESYPCRPFGRNIELPSQAGLFYICGPEGFERAVRAALTSFGVDPGAIFSEMFGRARQAVAGDPVSSEVRLAKSAKVLQWRADQDVSLLELAEQQGIEAPNSCRAGSCHSCETALLAGRVRYDPEPPVPPAPGRVLICCARPDSATLDLDL